MSRSAKKGPYVDEKLYKKVSKLNENRAKQPMKTWARACTIIPEFVGHTFEVHNGNKFIRVFVQEDHSATAGRLHDDDRRVPGPGAQFAVIVGDLGEVARQVEW